MSYKLFHFGKTEADAEIRWVSPLPHPCESLDWRGLCKKCLQNPERLGVRGQNLENKELRSVLAVFLPTASALTIICLIACG